MAGLRGVSHTPLHFQLATCLSLSRLPPACPFSGCHLPVHFHFALAFLAAHPSLYQSALHPSSFFSRLQVPLVNGLSEVARHVNNLTEIQTMVMMRVMVMTVIGSGGGGDDDRDGDDDGYGDDSDHHRSAVDDE